MAQEVQQVREYYRVKEFCSMVGISERHYYRLRADGDGPRLTKLGGRYLVSHAEMRRWMGAHTERTYFDVD